MTKPYASGFAVQLSALRARLTAGMPRRGWKIGFNVPEFQRTLGLSHSLVGWLDGDRVFRSGATIDTPPASRLHVEPELCVRVVASVTGEVDLATARAAVDAVAPALELVDYAKPASGLPDMVAHSMFHFGIVLGDWAPAPADGQIRIAESVRMRSGAELAGAPRPELVPGDVGEIVQVVARLLDEAGERLLEGDVILSGSFVARALPLAPGQTAVAELGSFGEVRCTAHE